MGNLGLRSIERPPQVAAAEEDRRGEWKDYDPDRVSAAGQLWWLPKTCSCSSCALCRRLLQEKWRTDGLFDGSKALRSSGDDYDVRTAPLLPPPADRLRLARRQLAALRGRIQKGGKPEVLAHYRKVAEVGAVVIYPEK